MATKENQRIDAALKKRNLAFTQINKGFKSRQNKQLNARLKIYEGGRDEKDQW